LQEESSKWQAGRELGLGEHGIVLILRWRFRLVIGWVDSFAGASGLWGGEMDKTTALCSVAPLLTLRVGVLGSNWPSTKQCRMFRLIST
jgi:hypothetical protein